MGPRRGPVGTSYRHPLPASLQGGHRHRLVADVLTANHEGTLHGHEFFIRKAVGWALREYARTDPDWVLAYVDARAGELSGLSRREALKHLTPPGCGDPVGPARS